MPGELFDTCVFIDYWRGDPAAFTLMDDVKQKKKSASYSPISATELWQYTNLSRQEEIEYIAMTRFILTEAALDTSSAIIAGQHLRSLSRSQRRKLTADALIAATAVARGEAVRTRNVRDLQKFTGNVLSY